jgi:hypothetical protein
MRVDAWYFSQKRELIWSEDSATLVYPTLISRAFIKDLFEAPSEYSLDSAPIYLNHDPLYVPPNSST